jgi:hypothetical protein
LWELSEYSERSGARETVTRSGPRGFLLLASPAGCCLSQELTLPTAGAFFFHCAEFFVDFLFYSYFVF